MNAKNVVISLDDAFDYYEMSKRVISDKPVYCFIPSKNIFYKNKDKYKDQSIPFINSYEQCVKLIDEYLKHPSKNNYRLAFEHQSKESRNKVVDFLWFFEHIDGCADFSNFEKCRMLKVLKKWCFTNNFVYVEPQVYRPDNDYHLPD